MKFSRIKILRVLYLSALFAGEILFLSSCATFSSQNKALRKLTANKNYQMALNEIENSKIYKSETNKFLYLVEKATILDHLGRNKEAQKLFIQADKLADELYTVSISKEALTYISNESAQDYSGEDYEKVAIHTKLALSFLEQKNLNASRVEARKINNKLKEINNAYSKNKNRYAEDAFARYLAGSIYEARGETDAAIIDYGRAIDLYENAYSKHFATQTPDQLVKAYAKLLKKRKRQAKLNKLKKNYPKLVSSALASKKSQSEVLVFFEVDQIAHKEASEVPILARRQYVRISFPVIRPKSFLSVNNVGARVNKITSETEVIQNMDRIAASTLKDRRLRLTLKAGARMITKGILTDQVRQQYGELGGLAANLFSAATETADTRSWTSLPAGILATRMSLPPGKHSLVVFNRGREKTIPITTKKNQLTIIRAGI